MDFTYVTYLQIKYFKCHGHGTAKTKSLMNCKISSFLSVKLFFSLHRARSAQVKNNAKNALNVCLYSCLFFLNIMTNMNDAKLGPPRNLARFFRAQTKDWARRKEWRISSLFLYWRTRSRNLEWGIEHQVLSLRLLESQQRAAETVSFGKVLLQRGGRAAAPGRKEQVDSIKIA